MNTNDVNNDKNVNNVEACLDISYRKYLTIKSLEDLVEKSASAYELHNILEKYLITSYPKLKDDSAMVVMKKQLSDKKMPSDILEKIETVLAATPVSDNANLVVDKDSRTTLRYGVFEFSMPTYRYDLLLSRGSDEQILESALELASLMPGSQQWAIPLEDYQKLIDKHGPVIECFTSPFNSQNMRLGDYSFCSLIPCDNVFGSIGNFFDVDFSNTNQTLIVNPPFVETILEAAAKKCLEMLADDSHKSIVFYGPGWTDSKFYELFDSSQYLVKRTDLPKFKHYYEDVMSGKKIKAKFSSVIFVLKSKKIVDRF